MYDTLQKIKLKKKYKKKGKGVLQSNKLWIFFFFNDTMKNMIRMLIDDTQLITNTNKIKENSTTQIWRGEKNREINV